MKPLDIKKRFVVGLTGGFGSGKSTVLHEFMKKKTQTFSSDLVVHNLLRKPFIINKLIQHFGKVILYSRSHIINHSKLANIVFQSMKQRKYIEHLFHPIVLTQMKRFCRIRSGLILCEIPLLFEAKWEKYVNAIIVVWTPKETRIKRLRILGMTREQIKNRMKTQQNLASKRYKASYIIDNSHSPSKTKRQVDKLFIELKKKVVK